MELSPSCEHPLTILSGARRQPPPPCDHEDRLFARPPGRRRSYGKPFGAFAAFEYLPNGNGLIRSHAALRRRQTVLLGVLEQCHDAVNSGKAHRGAVPIPNLFPIRRQLGLAAQSRLRVAHVQTLRNHEALACCCPSPFWATSRQDLFPEEFLQFTGWSDPRFFPDQLQPNLVEQTCLI
jgi:hypothetical protein